MGSRKVTGFPAWASRFLEKQGYRLRGDVMNSHIQAWWGWYQTDNGFYQTDKYDSPQGGMPCRHLSLRPARMACDEWATLVMDDKTRIGSKDTSLGAWIGERLGGFVSDEVDHLSLAFALGTGAWAVDLDLVTDGESVTDAVAGTSFYDASQICPLETNGDESVSCAFVRRTVVGGRLRDQLQVHEPDPETGAYAIRTWMFAPERQGVPVVDGSYVTYLDTGSPLPTYALVRPAIFNTYHECTPLGVSVFDDAQDAIKCVDEAFDSMYWRLRVCQPRMVVDESGLARDKMGNPDLPTTVDQRIFKVVKGGVSSSTPTTVYDPGLQATETEVALNSALSTFSAKCGFGPNYFSYSRQGGLKTATEVTADNSQLFRNVKRHEASVKASIERLVAGAYSAECALRGVTPKSLDVNVEFDDSIVKDSATERALMKDDISRGLCPAWLYPMTYYGMSEEEARQLVGAQPGQTAVPEEE